MIFTNGTRYHTCFKMAEGYPTNVIIKSKIVTHDTSNGIWLGFFLLSADCLPDTKALILKL